MEKTLILGKTAGRRRRAQQGEQDSITNSVDMNLSKLWEAVKARGASHAAAHGAAKSQT